MDCGFIKFTEPSQLTRRVLVRKKSEDPPAKSFPEFITYIRRVFGLDEYTIVRIKYKRGREVVVVEDEEGWEAACWSLSEDEDLPVDIEVRKHGVSDPKRVPWRQITIKDEIYSHTTYTEYAL